MAQPTASISPETLNVTIGGRFTLDASASTAGAGESLVFAWSFLRVPVGSTVEADGFQVLDEDGARVSFVPDYTGPYLVQVAVTNELSETATAVTAILVQAGIASADATDTPDGSFFFQVISDAWEKVEHRAMFSTVWSGYIQIIAADLLRAYQADYNKSIQTVQELEHRRWLPAHPGLDFSAASFIGYWGPVQQGTGAFTTDPRAEGLGFSLTATEWLFISGGGIRTAQFLTVLEGPNTGTYAPRRLNADQSGYVLSPDTPLPAPGAERLIGRTDGTLYRLRTTLFSAGADFVTAGVLVGDIVRIEGASDAGYYQVVGVAATQLTLDRPMTRARTRVTFAVYRPVRAQLASVATELAEVVYLPASEADLSVYQGAALEGEATLLNAYEIEVEARHVLLAAVGRSITITGGDNGGRSFGLASVNSAQTGYLVTSAFSGTFPQTVRYRISPVTQVTDRALILEGQAYRIRGTRYDSSFLSVDLGGPGPQWAVTIEGPPLPTNLENLSWVMGHTLRLPGQDLPAQGVCAGDLLDLLVQRDDRRRAATLRCQVLGAYADRLVLVAGTTAYDVLTEAEIAAFAEDFGLPPALLPALSAELTSRSLLSRYGNLPIDAATRVQLRGLFGVYLRPQWLTRNTHIALDARVRSVPMLTEFPRPPDVEESEAGFTYLAPDGTAVVTSRAPVLLLENETFTVGDENDIRGTRAQTTAGSAVVALPYASLLLRRVRAGDRLVLENSLDYGTYYIRRVLDDTHVELTTVLRFDRTGIRYRVLRGQEGTFLRLLPGTFTPTSPAPRYLWAPTTYLSSDEAVEANFGELVNLTSEQLDAYGVSQVTYRDAVAALMYVWATGPTLSNVALGTSILLGLPITDTPARIVEIAPTYRPDAGRVLLEEILTDGTPAGIFRSVLYEANPDDSTFSFFSGLGTNPDTGSTYEVGDVLPAYRTLARAVYVRDGIKEPPWGDASPLERLHRWEVQVDAAQIDSRDLPLVSDFLNAVRPVYTLPSLVLVLYLLDTAVIEDELSLEGALYLYDDPANGFESTSMLDDDNGSSLSLRHLDTGAYATRVLFEGHDLVTTSGESLVASARGGFVLPLAAPANPAFTTSGGAWGVHLVRAAVAWMHGDLLLIRSGPNQGIYEVAEIIGDTELRLQQVGGFGSLHDEMAPWSREPSTLESAEEQRFTIVRIQQNPLTGGQGMALPGTGTVTNGGGNFLFDGVQPGDILVVLLGPDKGRYEIREVVATGPEPQRSTQLIVNYLFTAPDSFPYVVERPALLANPVFEQEGTTTAGSPILQVQDALLSPLQTGDSIRLLSYPEAGRVFRLLDVLSDDELYIWPTPLYDSTGTVEVTRAFRDVPEDSDALLEPLWAEEQVELRLTPRMEVVASTPVSILSGMPSIFTSGTVDFTAAGVWAGDVVEVEDAPGGAYHIASVSGATITVDTYVSAGTVVNVRILRTSPEFDVVGDLITSLSGVDYEALGVSPGDMFIPDGMEAFVIADVSGTTFRTTRTVGTLTATGCVQRGQVKG